MTESPFWGLSVQGRQSWFGLQGQSHVLREIGVEMSNAYLYPGEQRIRRKLEGALQ